MKLKCWNHTCLLQPYRTVKIVDNLTWLLLNHLIRLRYDNSSCIVNRIVML